jgi:hypothetical protein
MTKSVLPLCLAGLFVGTALGRDQVFEVTPLAGYRFGGEVENTATGDKYSFADGPAYGLMLGFGPSGSEMKVELLWSRQDSSVNLGNVGLGKVDLTVDQIQIGARAETGNDRLRQYVSGMAGATYFSTEDYGSDTKFSLGLGVGAKYFLFRNLAVSVDLRGFCTVVESEGSFLYYNGATVASFSGSTLWQGQASVAVTLAF